MKITSRGYMQTRGLEVGLAFMMGVIGYTLLKPGQTFGQPSYSVLRTWVTEDACGWVLVITMIIRFAVIWINSYWTATPLFRLLGCAVGGGFWFSVAFALGAGDYSADANPILPPLCACIFVLEAYSGLRTGMDVVTLDSLWLQRLAYWRKRRARDRADA